MINTLVRNLTPICLTIFVTAIVLCVFSNELSYLLHGYTSDPRDRINLAKTGDIPFNISWSMMEYRRAFINLGGLLIAVSHLIIVIAIFINRLYKTPNTGLVRTFAVMMISTLVFCFGPYIYIIVYANLT